ncbi:ABC transporter ATP-binding protein [Maricaulaceae bacterium EIL42A08]|nr:ABC transporter ATP-binding protein [Maricaulaceae bacterium EIL42A08]
MAQSGTLTVSNASIAYGKDKSAVDGVDLSLSCGTVTALLGPSGSGKSTLLRAIAGLEALDGGEIGFAGEVWSETGQHKPPEARRCGVVFQDYALFPNLNALDNVSFGLNRLPRPERRKRAQQELDGVELGHRAKAFPHELSGGEQQRVALARALATDPDVMLLDEPFSGLDRRLRNELRDTTARALKDSGAATLIVTHDAEEALSLADTIALMTDGKIIQVGAPDTLYLKPTSLAAARLLGDVEYFDGDVIDGHLQTPLGAFDARAIGNATKARALIRPEGIAVGAGSSGGVAATIVERRLAGGHARLSCALETGNVVQARVELTNRVDVGARVQLSVDAHFVSVVTAGSAAS